MKFSLFQPAILYKIANFRLCKTQILINITFILLTGTVAYAKIDALGGSKEPPIFAVCGQGQTLTYPADAE